MGRNKIHHSVKGIIRVARFFTLRCEKGQMHEDKVKFDQVNNTAMEGVDHLGRRCSMNGGKILDGGNPNVWGPRKEGFHLHKRMRRQP